MNFSSQTPISTFSLQAKDWHFLASIIMFDTTFDDLEFNLKSKFQVASPPTGTTLVAVENQYVGVLLYLFYLCHTRNGKEPGKNTRNRFRTALEALALSEITAILADIDADDVNIENLLQEAGRKFLRGKLG